MKHLSSGYASFNYEEAGEREASLVKVEIVVNNESCDPLSFISHTDKAVASGRKLALKLKDVLQKQNFEIVIQAKIGGKVRKTAKYNEIKRTHVITINLLKVDSAAMVLVYSSLLLFAFTDNIEHNGPYCSTYNSLHL